MTLAGVLGFAIAGLGALAATANPDAGRASDASSDAATDPWQAEAQTAAAKERELRETIEQKSRAHCVTELNMADYDARHSYPQAASASRQVAEDCLARARAAFRSQANETASMEAFYERQRVASRKAAAERRVAQEHAQERQQAEVRSEAEDEAADERESQARLKDPAFIRAEISAQLCYVETSRKHAKAMIENERQGAREGLGVIDKEEVYKWQGELVIVSKLEHLAKADLKARKLSALPCKAGAAANDFADCIYNVRQSTMIVDADEDEYLASAKRIAEYAPSCMPWNRLTPDATAAARSGSR